MGEAIYPKVRLFTMKVRLFHGQSYFLSSLSELKVGNFPKGRGGGPSDFGSVSQLFLFVFKLNMV